MDSDFWHARWHANQIGFHQDEINPYLVRYWPALALAAQARVFVPLCGKTLDMIWLLERGHSVLGVEISPLAVEAFFADNRLSPHIHTEAGYTRWSCDRIEILCGDFFALGRTDLGRIDALYDRAALIALTPAQRRRYAAGLGKLLTPGVAGLLVTLDYDQQQMAGPPFAVAESEVGELFGDGFAVERLEQVDVLAAHPRFAEKGLSALEETVYRLQRR